MLSALRLTVFFPGLQTRFRFRQIFLFGLLFALLTSLPFASSSSAQSSAPAVLAIDAGGGAASPFVADEYYSGGSAYSVGATIDTSHVTNPAPQAVYQSQRYGSFTYTLPGLTPSAGYTLRLHFAETYYGLSNVGGGGAGKRAFNVAVSGQAVLSNFDIYAAAGKENTAVVKQFPATADASGNITVAFTVGNVDQPIVSGIEVLAGSPTPALASVAVSPSSSILHTGGTQALTATAFDQYGNPMAPQPAFAWTVVSGVGTVSASGVYSAGPTTGSATVQASTSGQSSTVSGTASVSVSTGSIAGSGAALSSGQTVNLTALGTLDWAHWGLNGAQDKTSGEFDHKAASGTTPVGLISNYSGVSTGAASYASGAVNYNWTDGTPTPTATNASSVYVLGYNGISMTVPADTTPRTLTVFVGGYADYATLAAHLSDSSAADYTDSSFGYDKPGNLDGVNYGAAYTLTYRAASAGQTLTVTWTQTHSNASYAKAQLDAAALALTPSSTQVLTSVTVSPASSTIGTNGTQTLAATALDQSGNPMAPQPAFAWTVVSGVGTVSTSGLYSAGSTAGNATVKASTGSVNGTATVTVRTPLAGLFSTGVDASGNLLADGAADPHYSITSGPDGAGNAAQVTLTDRGPLPFTWLPSSGSSKWVSPRADQSASPEPPGAYVYKTTFNLTGLDPSSVQISGQMLVDDQVTDVRLNGVSLGLTAPYNTWTPLNITSGLQAGANTLEFLVTNGGPSNNPSGLQVQLTGTGNAASSAPKLTSIVISPNSATLSLNGTQQFAATAKDQNGTALATQPAFTWSVVSGGVGTVSTTGLYSAGTTAGSATVQASSGTVSGTAAVTVTNAAPTVASAASASPNPATRTTTVLSVLGADDGGEANLVYTWVTTGTPPAGVTFSANGTNAAKNTTATFTKSGSYSFQVTIKDAGGLSVTSSATVIVNATSTSIVVSPTPVTVATNGTQQFTASAQDQFGAALVPQPTIVWAVDAGGSGTIVSATGAYTAGAVAGTATVRATSGTVSGTAAVTVTQSAPAAPTGLTATPGNASVALSWTAPSGSGLTYNIKRGTASGGPYTAVGSSGTTMCMDSGLTNGTPYYYVVTAVGSMGESGSSNQASATPSATALLAPMLSAQAQNAQVTLTWTSVTGAASYNLYRSTTPGGEGSTAYQKGITPFGPNPNYSDSSLANGTTYYYQVTAVNSSGEGPKSGEASATPGAAVLAAPLLKGVASSTKNTLTWSLITGATSYNLYRTSGQGAPGFLYKTGLVTSSFTDPGLTNGTAYGYYVCAVSASGQGSQSNTVLLTPGSPSLAAPSLSAQAASSTQINLTWSPVTGATSYNLYRSASAGGEGSVPYKTGITQQSYSVTFSDTGLTSGTPYYYIAVPVGPGGEGASSNEASATPGSTALAAPALKGVAGSGQVTLTWSSVTGAASYNLYRTSGQGGPGLLYKTGLTASPFTDPSLTNGSQYTYSVTAVALSGEGAASNQITLVPGSPALAAPLLSAHSPSSTEIDLVWTGVAGAASYNLYRSTTPGGEGSVPYLVNPVLFTSGGAYRYSDTGNGTALTANQTYYYNVVAVGPGGEGTFSLEASATPGASSLPAPANLTATADPTRVAIAVSWTAVSGATSYNLYRFPYGGMPSLYVSGLTVTSYTDTNIIPGGSFYYYVTAVNKDGEGTSSNSANAAVNGFYITCPSSVTITRGSTAAISLTLSSLGTFTNNVLLSGSGTPAGTQGVFYPAAPLVSSQLGYSTTGNLYFTVGSTTSPGSYPITVTGTANGFSYSTSIILLVQ